MKRKVFVGLAVIGILATGLSWAEDVQWVRVTVLLERGSEEAQKTAETLIRGGIYSLAEVERRGQEAIDREILDRVRFLAGEIHDVEQSMRLGIMLSRQYYLPLRVGQQAVVPVIDLNPRLGVVLNPQRFEDDRVVCKIQFLEPEGPPGADEYTGEPISLTLKEADIRDVIKTFGVVTQREITVDEDIRGQVTVDLRDLPWDQAFDVVLRTNNLGWKAEGETLRVAPLDELSQRKTVRTEATINLPRGGAGSATIASRGDAENRTVVLVVESVAGEPELVAERDGLVRPPAFGITSRTVLDTSAMGDVLVFRAEASEDGDLKDVEVLATPFSDDSEMFLAASRTWRTWTVLDEQVRRIDAVVGYGLRFTHAPTRGLTTLSPVERIGIEVEVGLPPAHMLDTYPDHHILSVYLKDLDSGEVISAPRMPVRKGEEGTLRASIPEPGGEYSDFEMKVLIAEDGSHVGYSWTLTSKGKVLSSHTAKFEL
jgi:hypothetical protein